MNPNAWTVTWHAFDPARSGHEATAFTCSNGYIATRGTHPERDDGLPATNVAGLFTDDSLGFRTLATCAHWLTVRLEADGKVLDPGGSDITGYQRCYDLRRGLVRRRLQWRIGRRRQLSVETEHFCSLASRRVGVQLYRVRASGAPARVKLTAQVTGRIKTRNEELVAGHRVTTRDGAATITARTVTGEYQVAQHAIVRVSPAAEMRLAGRQGTATWEAAFTLKAGQTVTLYKVVGFAADRDAGATYVAKAVAAAEAVARRGYTAELRRHAAAWADVWRDADLEIVGDDAAALALHYATAQLLGHSPRDDDRVSLAAKPLCGEGYRGHVFWDTDLFMTPAITALRPELGKRLANYRWETLPGARKNAAKWGYRGAWYPWESSDDGTETTPRYWLNTDGRRMPVTCWKYEIHSVCDVAYAAWDYYAATGDLDWLLTKGAEVLVETARFWVSRATYAAERKRYEILDVCGPDECHERVNNSAYINVLAARNIAQALRVLEMLRRRRPRDHERFCAALKLSARELTDFRRVAARMHVARDPKTGWYRQFDGFEDLALIDPLTAPERIEHPPAAAATQLIKQADIIMLLYLLRDQHPRQAMQINWDYYVPRTQHNTSLSAATHASVAARLGLPRTALRYFTEAVNMDLLNWRGDSDRGLHGAALGGAICGALFGFGGLQFHEDHLSVDPILPPGWQRLRLPFMYQGRRLLLEVTPTGFELRFRAPGKAVTVVNAGQRRMLRSRGVLKGTLLPRAAQRTIKGIGRPDVRRAARLGHP
jgi:kojibiose phosphorylase